MTFPSKEAPSRQDAIHDSCFYGCQFCPHEVFGKEVDHWSLYLVASMSVEMFLEDGTGSDLVVL